MLELLALAGVAGVCTVANSLLDLEPLTSSSASEDVDGTKAVATTFDYVDYPSDVHADDTVAVYKDLLAIIFDDEEPVNGLSREPALTSSDLLASDTSTDAADTPVISDYSNEDQLIVAYPHDYAGDMSVDVQDRDGDAHISVGGATVAVLQGAAGSVTAKDIALVPDGNLS